eukprot:2418130-Pleurochrysis_carterae.AAC.1
MQAAVPAASSEHATGYASQLDKTLACEPADTNAPSGKWLPTQPMAPPYLLVLSSLVVAVAGDTGALSSVLRWNIHHGGQRKRRGRVSGMRRPESLRLLLGTAVCISFLQ